VISPWGHTIVQSIYNGHKKRPSWAFFWFQQAFLWAIIPKNGCKTGKKCILTYLANGWPIASGVIEGACRHLVKDRFELSGMRWLQDGARAVAKQ
jgi:hypothetical protein